jgi:hypothetical protein
MKPWYPFTRSELKLPLNVGRTVLPIWSWGYRYLMVELYYPFELRDTDILWWNLGTHLNLRHYTMVQLHYLFNH